MNWLWFDYVALLLNSNEQRQSIIHSFNFKKRMISHLLSSHRSRFLFFFFLVSFHSIRFGYSKCRKCWFDFVKEILSKFPSAQYVCRIHLPNRQFSFAFAFINFRCNNITCKTKIGYFTCMIVRYENVTSRQITMNNLSMRNDIKKNETLHKLHTIWLLLLL